MGYVLLGIIVAILIVFLVALIMGIRIIRPTHRGLVERLGKYHRFCEPGFHVIVPFIDRMFQVDIREVLVEAQLALFVGVEGEMVPLVHLVVVQVEERRGVHPHVAVPSVGEDDVADVQEKGCHAFAFHVLLLLRLPGGALNVSGPLPGEKPPA